MGLQNYQYNNIRPLQGQMKCDVKLSLGILATCNITFKLKET